MLHSRRRRHSNLDTILIPLRLGRFTPKALSGRIEHRLAPLDWFAGPVATTCQPPNVRPGPDPACPDIALPRLSRTTAVQATSHMVYVHDFLRHLAICDGKGKVGRERQPRCEPGKNPSISKRLLVVLKLPERRHSLVVLGAIDKSFKQITYSIRHFSRQTGLC